MPYIYTLKQRAMTYPYQLTSFDAYKEAYKKSIEDPAAFWSDVANHFTWRKKWDTALEWNFKEPKVEWFKGGKLNITENCLDRHIPTKGHLPAMIWEPNAPDEAGRVLTYSKLLEKVCQFAQVLKNNGVQRGDRVCIYMGMIPELAIAVLACARIGAIHSVVFGGFSAQSIADRLLDANATYIVTCDGAYRGAKDIPLKSVIDDALIGNKTVKRVIVATRTRTPVSMIKGRDLWWEDEMKQVEEKGITFIEAEEMDAEDPLFILYTSGSTGIPKGVVHTCGGYMVFTNYTFVNVFQYKPGQIHFCTADIGWITGHSYIVYAPLSAGGTSLMFEGIPTYPDSSRFWRVVEKHKVNIFYTAPTAIRALMREGDAPVTACDRSSIRLLGTVGEPINPEAWMWYHRNVGGERCPIVDTFWQTETGGHMITPLPGATPLVPGSCTLPLPGIMAAIVDESGNDMPNGAGGMLVVKRPWPSMIRNIWGDSERFKKSYFPEELGGTMYLAGDGAVRSEDRGYFRITGRIDDVLNVSGHRMGTMEIESALVAKTDLVAEAAVVGRPDDVTGEAIVAFVVLKGARPEGEEAQRIAKILRDWVATEIGPIAKPKEVRFGDNLPKTRSGKIMRRLLRTLAKGETITQDTSTLENPAILEQLAKAL